MKDLDRSLWHCRPMYGPRGRSDVFPIHHPRLGVYFRPDRRRISAEPEGINFHFSASFDGWIFMQARGNTLRVAEYGKSFTAVTGRRSELRTIRLPTARQRAFWREARRLGIWQWPYETLPGGLDGSSFEVELSRGKREVRAGWWGGGPRRPLRLLCAALERLSGRRIHVRR